MIVVAGFRQKREGNALPPQGAATAFTRGVRRCTGVETREQRLGAAGLA